MITKRFSVIVTLAFLPITTTAQIRDTGALLRGRVEALGQAGFAGMTGIPTQQAPNAAPASPAVVPVDETTQAVAALVEVVQRTGIEGGFSGAVLRKVGLAFDGEAYRFKVVQIKGPDSTRQFVVTSARGSIDILLESVTKVEGRRQLRSYLIAADGRLLGAAVSWKENELILTDSIPLAQADTGYREQLGFWLQYYRANLKNP